MKTPFCFINLHFWKYKKEKHTVKDHPLHRETIYVNIRECTCCGKRQHHLMQMTDGRMLSWKDCKFNSDETISLNPLEF